MGSVTPTTKSSANGSSSDWTVVTLKDHMDGLIGQLVRAQDIQMENLNRTQEIQFANLKEMLQQRYTAQEIAGQIAFNAQQTALATGLTSAERGVETALAAAKEATGKAEFNANERLTQFRSESGLQLASLSDKTDNEIRRVAERLGEFSNQLNTIIGRAVGATEYKAEARLGLGQALTGGGLLVAITALVTGLFFK